MSVGIRPQYPSNWEDSGLTNSFYWSCGWLDTELPTRFPHLSDAVVGLLSPGNCNSSICENISHAMEALADKYKSQHLQDLLEHPQSYNTSVLFMYMRGMSTFAWKLHLCSDKDAPE